MSAYEKIDSLLNPKSIAILGCSAANTGGETLQNLLTMNYPGKLYPVHPRHTEVLGVKCYPSLGEIPDNVECCVVALRSTLIPGCIEEMKAKGVRAAVIFASGFSESGEEGRRLQQQVSQMVADAGIAVCGANCLGLINIAGHVPMYSAPVRESYPAGKIGLVAHSGSACIAMMSAARGVGFSYVISCGNEAGLGVADYFRYLLEDENTKVLAGYLEAIRDPEAMAEVARLAVEKGKPIVIFKTGRSAIGQKTAAAHSGALASPTAVVDAFFRQNHILSVKSFDELLETCELFAEMDGRLPTTDQIGCTAISGGQLGFTSDVAAEEEIEFAAISETAKERIRAVLPSFATAANPLDVTTAMFDLPAYKECIRAMADEERVGMVLVCQDAEAGMVEGEAAIYCDIADAMVEVQGEIGKPIVIFSPISAGFAPRFAQILREGGIPLLQGAHESLHAVRALMDWKKWTEERVGKRIARSRPAFDFGQNSSLSERESKKLLSLYQIPTAQDVLVCSEEEAAAAAAKIGYPVVLKVDSPDILHKTEAGVVALNLTDEAAVRSAYRTVLERAGNYAPQAVINGVSVQEQVPEGVEMMLGAKVDAHFGPTVMIGIGGIFVEVFKDYSLRMAPVDHTTAAEMVDQLKGKKLLYGARGRVKADVKALEESLVRFSELVADYADEIAEMDINPLIVLPEGKGAKAVDALIVRRAEKSEIAE